MSDECRKQELTRELVAIKRFMSGLKDKTLVKEMALGLKDKVEELDQLSKTE